MENPLYQLWLKTRATMQYGAYKIDLAVSEIPFLGSILPLDREEDAPVTLEGFIQQIKRDDAEKKQQIAERRVALQKELERDRYYKRV